MFIQSKPGAHEIFLVEFCLVWFLRVDLSSMTFPDWFFRVVFPGSCFRVGVSGLVSRFFWAVPLRVGIVLSEVRRSRTSVDGAIRLCLLFARDGRFVCVAGTSTWRLDIESLRTPNPRTPNSRPDNRLGFIDVLCFSGFVCLGLDCLSLVFSGFDYRVSFPRVWYSRVLVFSGLGFSGLVRVASCVLVV